MRDCWQQNLKNMKRSKVCHFRSVWSPLFVLYEPYLGPILYHKKMWRSHKKNDHGLQHFLTWILMTWTYNTTEGWIVLLDLTHSANLNRTSFFKFRASADAFLFSIRNWRYVNRITKRQFQQTKDSFVLDFRRLLFETLGAWTDSEEISLTMILVSPSENMIPLALQRCLPPSQLTTVYHATLENAVAAFATSQKFCLRNA